MIKKLVHFSDLHIRLFKDHDLYRSILEDAINQWKEIEPVPIPPNPFKDDGYDDLGSPPKIVM